MKDVSVEGHASGRMIGSSTIFQNSAVERVLIMIIMCGFLQFKIRRPSTPILKYRRNTALRSASDHCLSPHIMPFWIRRWHLFCQFIFCWSLRAFLSLSDCTEEPIFVSLYMGSSGRSTISGLGPSRVSGIIFSFANSASLYCNLHFSQQRGGSGVGLSQKASIPSGGVRLFAGCAMSYFFKIQ